MLPLALKKCLEITKVQRFILLPNFLLAILFIVMGFFIFDIKNLDALGSSFILERYLSLIGILLLTPLLYPEQNKAIKELVESKKTPLTEIYLTRIALAVLSTLVLVIGFVLIMQLNHCVFNPIVFIFGTLVTAFFLGALGFFAYSLSHNLIIGYMAALGYFMLNLFLESAQLRNLYLFSLSQNSLLQKYWLLGFGLLLFILAFIWMKIEEKRR